MRSRISFFLAIFLIQSIVLSAPWRQREVFPDTSIESKKFVTRSISGIAVDPNDNVWVQPEVPTEEMYVAKLGKSILVNAIYCFKPNGDKLSFSPIKILSYGSINDTLGGTLGVANSSYAWKNFEGRGLSTDKDGNILISAYDRLYKINYNTGQVMAKVILQKDEPVTKAYSDNSGNIFIGHYQRNTKIYQLSNDFSSIKTVLKATNANSRSIGGNPDQSLVFWGGLGNNYVHVYKYNVAESKLDSIGFIPGINADMITYGGHVSNKCIWVSSGSLANAPTQYIAQNDFTNDNRFLNNSYKPNTAYGFGVDGNYGARRDSLLWDRIVDKSFENISSIAFSKIDNSFAYVGLRNPNGIYSIRKLQYIFADSWGAPFLINYPFGFETFTGGQNVSIKWWNNKGSVKKIEYSSDNGITWNLISNTISESSTSHNWTVPNIGSVTNIVKISNDTFYHCSNAFAIEKKLKIDEHNTKVIEFNLSQNFPNPFNPTTKIEFSLPKSSFVTLKVYNILGQEVKTLLDEYRNAGYYNLTFDATNLTSGFYIAELRAMQYSKCIKMNLIK